MQEVRRKRSRAPRHARIWLLLLAAAVLLGALGVRVLLPEEEAVPLETHADTAQVLMTHVADEIARVAVIMRAGGGWEALQITPGVLVLTDEPDTEIAAGHTASILRAASEISCEAVLTDDPSLYLGELAAFGLDDPMLVATVAYTDEQVITLRVGGAVSEDDAGWLYMLVDGDERLFAIDRGTVEDLAVDRSLLRPVTQPTLHAARFDWIMLTGAEDAAIGAWSLEGDIGDADAGDRWHLTAPMRYPADAEAVGTLKQNLASLRLGAYVGPATPENLGLYGFEAPRLTIELHQAAGSFGTTNAAGEWSLTDWPESSFKLVVGGALSEDIDYVLYEDAIYTGSHYLLEVFMSLDWSATLSRYIVPTALGNLARLTVETADGTDEYVITRTEQVAENNELVTDGNGSVVYDYVCELNGVPCDYEAFEATYGRLIVATASGRLPEGWEAEAEPHTVFTFRDVSGEAHRVALTDFDALHDAVIIDGVAVFYLIKGGFAIAS